MKNLFTTLCICCALVLVGCIDREFELTDISGEVTVGGEELIVPLGNIEQIAISDLLGDNELLKPNEDGIYQISFSSFGEDPQKYESISIEGISIPPITGLSPKLEPITFSFGQLPTSLLMSGINEPLDINLPTEIGDVIQITPINLPLDVDFPFPSILPQQGNIDDAKLATLKSMDLSSISAKGEEEIVFNATLEILEQLEKVDWVEFGCDIHPYGAPFNINIDLRGMRGIVGAGTIDVKVEFPEGYYLLDENGKDEIESQDLAAHNIFSKKINLSANPNAMSILVFLNKIDYSNHTFTAGVLEINDHIKYSYSLNLDLAKGSYNLNQKPSISLIAEDMKYRDAEVRINYFEVPAMEHPISYSLNGMPSGISVERVGFKDTNLNLSLKGLEWCIVKDNKTGDNISPKIEIDLPNCMRFGKHDLLVERVGEQKEGTNEVGVKNVLMASTTELSQGISLPLEYVECKNSTGVSFANGALNINDKIVAAIHMESLDGHTVLVSTITPPENLQVVLNVAETRLNLDTNKTEIVSSDEHVYNFDLKDNIPTIAQTIEVPDMISSIKHIEIGKAGSETNEPLSMSFKLDAGNSFPVDELDINVSVNLGKLLRPTQKMFDEGLITENNNGDYILAINETWRPKQAPLAKTLEFDALENIPTIANGKITLNQSFPVIGSAKIKSGENIKLSEVDNAQINIDFKIDDIEVRTFVGKVDISVKPETMFVELGDFGDLGDLGIDINSLNLNPILKLNLADNPTGVGFKANITIKTYDATGKEMGTITIPTISVAGNGPTNLVISTPRNANKYNGNDVKFIPVQELSKLLSNGIPAKIAVDMEVASNKAEEITLDLKKATDGYKIEYQYEVILPLEFDGDINLSCETSISGLNETFVELANTTNGLKVGDIGLIAELDTTIPFDIVLSAELINAEGTSEGIAARLNINNCIIEGYNKDKDGEKKTSKIDLDFDLGESGSLEGLKNADGVKLKFSIYSTDSDIASLAGNQSISGKLKLRVRDGLTVNIFDFLKGEEE